jgi:hypothetical protein
MSSRSSRPRVRGSFESRCPTCRCVPSFPSQPRSLANAAAPRQTWWYKNILTKNYAALSGTDPGVSLLNVAMELKKASNHPFLFDGAETRSEVREETLKGIVMNSGKMVLLDKLLARLKQDGHRVLVFSQMVRMLSVLSLFSPLIESLLMQIRLQGHSLRLLCHSRIPLPASRRYRALRDSSQGYRALQRTWIPRLCLPPLDACRRTRNQLGDGRYGHHLRQ